MQKINSRNLRKSINKCRKIVKVKFIIIHFLPLKKIIFNKIDEIDNI